MQQTVARITIAQLQVDRGCPGCNLVTLHRSVTLLILPLDSISLIRYHKRCVKKHGRLAQLVELLPYKQAVTGSSPVPSILP
jgi:hypothetical protein